MSGVGGPVRGDRLPPEFGCSDFNDCERSVHQCRPGHRSRCGVLEHGYQCAEAGERQTPCQPHQQPEPIDQCSPALAMQMPLPPCGTKEEAKPGIESVVGVEGRAHPVWLRPPPTLHARRKEASQLAIETDRLVRAVHRGCNEKPAEGEHESR